MQDFTPSHAVGVLPVDLLYVTNDTVANVGQDHAGGTIQPQHSKQLFSQVAYVGQDPISPNPAKPPPP